MQTIVQEDLLVYYTLILWLSFAFQVIALKRVRFPWILRDFLAGSLLLSSSFFLLQKGCLLLELFLYFIPWKRLLLWGDSHCWAVSLNCAFIFSDVEIPETLDTYVTLTENALKNISGRHWEILSIARCKYYSAQAKHLPLLYVLVSVILFTTYKYFFCGSIGILM